MWPTALSCDRVICSRARAKKQFKIMLLDMTRGKPALLPFDEHASLQKLQRSFDTVIKNSFKGLERQKNRSTTKLNVKTLFFFQYVGKISKVYLYITSCSTFYFHVPWISEQMLEKKFNEDRTAWAIERLGQENEVSIESNEMINRHVERCSLTRTGSDRSAALNLPNSKDYRQGKKNFEWPRKIILSAFEFVICGSLRCPSLIQSLVKKSTLVCFPSDFRWHLFL